MANPLTGDFQAVLQVSGATVNRLMASMHQNAFANKDVPSFPHHARMRIGDTHPIDGVRAYVEVQIGVPRLTLLHGSTDRFALEVGIRARVRPDSDSTAFPAFIHGTVKADYRIHAIDPECAGWGTKAANHIWVRVVRDSVRFSGTAEDDAAGVGIFVASSGGSTQASIAKVQHQIAELLATQFEATPHKLEKGFRRGQMRTLNPGQGPAAVALPLPVNGSSGGAVESLENVFLDSNDFAVALSAEHIVTVMHDALGALSGFRASIDVRVKTPRPFPDIDTKYDVGINTPSIEWHGHTSFGNVRIKLSGWATTEDIWPDASFDLVQDITVQYDAGALKVTPLAPQVTPHVSGLFGGLIADFLRPRIESRLKPIVEDECKKAEPALARIKNGESQLTVQLATLAEDAAATFTTASFVDAGVVLAGRVTLPPRNAVVVLHDKTPEQDGYSALESWIPGGRIDRFEWAWTWSGQSQPERATFDDRFVLRRPPGQTGRWGIALGLQTPLPGLDGRGRVCLKVKGVHVDATTGALVPVESRLKCVRFGLDILGRPRDGLRLFLLDEPELSQDVPFPQLSLLRAGAGHDATTASNTLLVYAAERWDPETLHVIRRGLEACRRYDASLALLVLFRENTLGSVPRDVVVDIERSARDFGLAAMVNEDVGGGWSRAYGFESGTQSWRLIAPDGTVTWSHEGSIEAAALGGVLDASLVHSRAVLPVAVRPSVDIGTRVSIAALRPPITAESRCPPVPLVRTEVGSIVTFVQSGSGASEAQLRKLSSQHTQRSGGPVVIAVIDGADDRGAESLKNRLGLDDFVALADPSGAIADRLGVAIWPTTVILDGSGVVQAIDVGLGDSSLGDTDRPSLV